MTDAFNQDRLEGDTRTLAGGVKSVLGDALGDDRMKAEGETQRLGGKAQSAYGDLAGEAQSYIDKARAFAKERPFVAAALAGVIGVALLNTLRGK